jgi:hypothetical protein
MNGTLKCLLGCVTCPIDFGKLNAPVERVTFTTNPDWLAFMVVVGLT